MGIADLDYTHLHGSEEEPEVPGRLPRVVRLLALAHRFDHLLRTGQVGSYAELARRGRVSRARVSQIMQLLLLAPAIQEEVLFLPPVRRGRAPVPTSRARTLGYACSGSRNTRGAGMAAGWRGRDLSVADVTIS